MTRAELQLRLERELRRRTPAEELSEWAKTKIMENDNAPDSLITDEERDFLQGYLEHLVFSVEPAFPLTGETIRELLGRLLANLPAWEADEHWG